MQVLVGGVQRVGLRFAVSASELLLNAINRVKEITAIQLEPLSTQSPVGTLKKMQEEDPSLEFSQRTPRDQFEVRTVLLLFSSPGALPLAARYHLRRYAAHIFLTGAIVAATP